MSSTCVPWTDVLFLPTSSLAWSVAGKYLNEIYARQIIRQLNCYKQPVLS